MVLWISLLRMPVKSNRNHSVTWSDMVLISVVVI